MDLEAYIQVVPLVPDVILPFRATNSSTGYDVSSSTNVQITAHSTVTVPLGFKIAFPSNLHCSLNPLSSLSSKGLHVSVGTIDPDYRGEVKVILYQLNKLDIHRQEGTKNWSACLHQIRPSSYHHSQFIT